MSDLERRLQSAVWRLTEGDERRLIAPVVRLLPRGVVGGIAHPSLRRWGVTPEGALAFFNETGVATVSFPTREDLAGVLPGRARGADRVDFWLEPIPMPCGADVNPPVSIAPVELVVHAPGRLRRRNLVVLRANERSIHSRWIPTIDEADRTWDLCISWYGAEPTADLGPHEYYALQDRQTKYAAVHDLFEPESPLWSYEQFWFPDDDILTTNGDVNTLFEIAQRHALLLCQPSLIEGSHVSHLLTRQQPDKIMRFVRFVEVMCPLFSREALQACVESFRGSVSGWGLDAIWPGLLGGVANRIAVIDAVAVAHTRPVGGSYAMDAAAAEMARLLALHGAQMDLGCLGFISKTAIPTPDWPGADNRAPEPSDAGDG